MKLNLIGLVLCAFVVSTFGHDFLNRHHGHNLRNSHLHARGNTDNTTCWCPCPCTPPPPTPTTTSTVLPTTPTITTPPITSPPITSSPTTDTPITTPSSLTPTPIPVTNISDSTLSANTTDITPSANVTTPPIITTVNVTLQVHINASTGVIAVVNASANFAIVFDIRSNLIVIINGKSGGYIIYNLVTNIGYYISVRANVSWNASNQSFASFFASLNLQILWNYATSNGTKFTLVQITAEILGQIRLSLQYFGVLSTNSNALTVWLQISLRISVSLQGSSRGLLILFGTGVTTVTGDLSRIAGVFEGLSAFFVRIGVSIDTVIRANIKISLTYIFNSHTSIDIFIYIVRILRTGGITVSGNISGSSNNSFAWASDLSGSSAVGASGVITVAAKLTNVLLNSGNQTEIRVFIQILIEFYTSNNATITIEEVDKLLIQFRDSAKSNGLDQIAAQIDSFIKGTLIINGINIRTTIVILFRSNPPLENIVRILVVIRGVVPLEVSIGNLLLVLFGILGNSNGAVVISILLGVTIQVPSNYNSVLAYIVSDVRLRDVLFLIASGGRGWYQFLLRLRVVVVIFRTIDVGLRNCGSQTTLAEISLRIRFDIIVLPMLTIIRVQIQSQSSVSIGGSYNIGGSFKHLDSHHEQVKEGHHQHLHDKHLKEKHLSHHSEHLEHDKHLSHNSEHLDHEKHLSHHSKHLEHAKLLDHHRQHESDKHHV